MKHFKPTPKALLEYAQENVSQIDYIQRKPSSGKGIVRFMTGYYWSKENGPENLMKRVDALLTKLNAEHYVPFEIQAMGNNWMAFNGGAPIHKQSHYWVDVKFLEVTVDK